MTPDPNLDRELEFHRDQLEREQLARGASPDEAAAVARRKLGNTTLIRETVSELSPFYAIEAAGRHVRFALRAFRRHPGAYGSAMAILALGIGMSVAMYSLVKAVVLNPLPFPDQHSIQVIWKTDPHSSVLLGELDYAEVRDLQSGVPALEAVAAMPPTVYGYGRLLQLPGREPEQIDSNPVSHEFFQVLGVKPVLGRDFTLQDQQPGAAPVVILSDRLWRRLFAADRNVVGRQVRINGNGHTIIGVMAPEVDFPRGVQLWLPLMLDAMTLGRGNYYLQAIARVRPGFTAEQVRTQVDTLFQRVAREHPTHYAASQKGVVTPLPEYWTGSARQHLWISLGASLLLLVAACFSAGNLFLSRALARRRELATRASLGASASNILSQLLVEGFTASVTAAAAGLALAALIIRLLIHVAPGDIPRLADASLDPGSFAFAAAVAAVAAVLCSVVPAWIAVRLSIDGVLRQESGRTTATSRGRAAQNAFVLVQTTITVVLLSLSLFLFASYRALVTTDVGFANRDAVTMNLTLRGRDYTAQTRDDFYTKLLDRLRQSPGVTSAAAVLLRPLEGSIGWDVHYQFEAEAAAGKEARDLRTLNFEVVTPGYFATVGTPLVEGRDFSTHDTKEAEPVVIVSHSLAKRLHSMSGRDALGQRLRTGTGGKWMQIVGITADTRHRRVSQTGDDAYVSYLQANQPTNYLVIRGDRPVAELSNLVRRETAALDPSQAIAGVATIAELIERDTARHRFNMTLLVWFAACAMVLAAAGVYSVIAETVAARTREIAIKVALGAGRARMLAETARTVLICVALGEFVGLLGGYFVARAAADLLYSISPAHPAILGLTGAFLSAVSLVAAFVPASKATRRDPREALQAMC